MSEYSFSYAGVRTLNDLPDLIAAAHIFAGATYLVKKLEINALGLQEGGEDSELLREARISGDLHSGYDVQILDLKNEQVSLGLREGIEFSIKENTLELKIKGISFRPKIVESL